MKKDWGIEFQLITPNRTGYVWHYHSTQGITRFKARPDFVSSSKATFGILGLRDHPYQLDDIKLEPWDSYLYLSFGPDNRLKSGKNALDRITYTRTLLRDSSELVEELIAGRQLRHVSALAGVTNPTMANILTTKFGFKEDPNWKQDPNFKVYGESRLFDKNKSKKFVIASREAVIKIYDKYKGKSRISDRITSTGFVLSMRVEAFGRHIPLDLWH